MNWLSLFSGLVSLFNGVTELWNNRQLRKSGETKAKLEMLEEESRALKRATKVRNKYRSSDDVNELLKHPSHRNK